MCGEMAGQYFESDVKLTKVERSRECITLVNSLLQDLACFTEPPCEYLQTCPKYLKKKKSLKGWEERKQGKELGAI